MGFVHIRVSTNKMGICSANQVAGATAVSKFFNEPLTVFQNFWRTPNHLISRRISHFLVAKVAFLGSPSL